MGGTSFRGLLALSNLLLKVINDVSATEIRQSKNTCETTKYENKTRVFVMTDISNEPDDQMSLVRFLTYANELDIINIAAVSRKELLSNLYRNVLSSSLRIRLHPHGRTIPSTRRPSLA